MGIRVFPKLGICCRCKTSCDTVSYNPRQHESFSVCLDLRLSFGSHLLIFFITRLSDMASRWRFYKCIPLSYQLLGPINLHWFFGIFFPDCSELFVNTSIFNYQEKTRFKLCVEREVELYTVTCYQILFVLL